jgi:flavin reductase (DIM6/NTAB) family NADH-FMN oxidoreductase RutF
MIMKHMDYMMIAQNVMELIKKGVFLTVKSSAGLNTMTIGWATIGYVWGKPVMMVAVRTSRHTFPLSKRLKILLYLFQLLI